MIGIQVDYPVFKLPHQLGGSLEFDRSVSFIGPPAPCIKLLKGPGGECESVSPTSEFMRLNSSLLPSPRHLAGAGLTVGKGERGSDGGQGRLVCISPCPYIKSK